MIRHTFTMKFIKALWLFSLCTTDIHATTHWMVTETGLIQPRDDSPFIMAHPHDLIAFLNQDIRWANIQNLYHDLWRRQEVINKMWMDIERNTDVEIILSQDKNCMKVAPLSNLDWYTTIVDIGQNLEKNIPEEDYLLYTPSYGHDTEVPDCKKISSLTFSMVAFEHLESMMNRVNLTGVPAYAVPKQIATIMTLDQFGHWVTNSLRKNTSSWLHYNLASLYWKTKGDVPRSIECSRRAVHYAPRYYKDVALLNLGMMLHIAKQTDDAVTVLGASIDHDPTVVLNHYALANAYAVLGDFNSSIKHYDICLKLNPTFEGADTHKSGVLCHEVLIKKMLVLKQNLLTLRDKLIEFSNKEVTWLNSQTAFLKTMKHEQDIDFYKNVDINCAKMEEITGLKMRELKKNGNKNYFMKYFFDRLMVNPKWQVEKGIHAIDWVYNIQKLMFQLQMHTELETDFVYVDNSTVKGDVEILKEIGPLPLFPDVSPDIKGKIFLEDGEAKPATSTKPSVDKKSSSAADNPLSEFDTGVVLYPPTMKVSRNTEDFDRDPDWPSAKLCKDRSTAIPENLEIIYPVFLPFENKGLSLKHLLTHKIGVPPDVEHDVPWHPPICAQDKSTNKKSFKQQAPIDVKASTYLRPKLLQYVGDGDAEAAEHMQDAEIGQRIYAVMQTKLAPKWIAYTLASLYWRVRGNNVNAINCLLSASKSVDNKYKDIVLTSMASVYLEMGYFEEALAAAESAFRISLYEPATNFLLASLNMVKKHRSTHMFHLKQTLRVDPNFMDGRARALLTGWACMLKQLDSAQEIEFGDGDICTQVEPGMSMVCEKDGTNCHVSNIQCFSNQERGNVQKQLIDFRDSDAILRLLESKDDMKEKSPLAQSENNMFDEFIDNMPEERSDKQAHESHFLSMIKTVNAELKGCGSNGCRAIQPDEVTFNAADCSYQHLQLGYWLHIISFRQLLIDANLNLPQEIVAINPTVKKVPDCFVVSEPAQDFFLERILQVDVDGWEPVLSLMHQFAEVFQYFDYVNLGAKIAKYMEIKPRSFTGAIAAGWWCGAGGRGSCARRCAAAAFALAPAHLAVHALRPLAALLHMQSKPQDAQDIALLSFYLQPKNKIDAFLAAVSHTYMGEYDQACWMYRYSLSYDDKFLPAKACIQAAMCLMLYGDAGKIRAKED